MTFSSPVHLTLYCYWLTNVKLLLYLGTNIFIMPSDFSHNALCVPFLLMTLYESFCLSQEWCQSFIFYSFSDTNIHSASVSLSVCLPLFLCLSIDTGGMAVCVSHSFLGSLWGCYLLWSVLHSFIPSLYFLSFSLIMISKIMSVMSWQ